MNEIVSYVTNRNDVENLGLSKIDIQDISELYLLEARELGFDDANVNEELFESIYDMFITEKRRNLIPNQSYEIEDLRRITENERLNGYYSEDDLRRSTEIESLRNDNYGYGVVDGYDDSGLDERVYDDTEMKL